jgi:hypothetical protein
MGYCHLGAKRAEAAHKVVEAGLEEHLPSIPGFYVKRRDDGREFWSVSGMGGMTIPVRDLKGRIVRLMVRLDEPKPGQKYKWVSSKSKGGAGAGSKVHIPRFKGDKTAVRVTEGPLKADLATTLSGTLTIGLPGVNKWKLAAKLLKRLDAKTARVALDADARTNPHVAQALGDLVVHLGKHGFEVELETWDVADGKGIDDLLRIGKKPTILQGEAVAEAVKQIQDESGLKSVPAERKKSGLPEIQGNRRQLRDVTAEALAALIAANEPPKTFQRVGLLTRLRDAEQNGVLTMEPLVDAGLRGVLSRSADWFKITPTPKGDRVEPCAPPMEVVNDMASLPAWENIPHLEAVVESPVFDRKGRLVVAPGYHPDARLWLQTPPGFVLPPIPDNPTVAEVHAARDLLLVEMWGDFPFKDAASRANALAALLLLFVRQMIDGPTPLHLIDAPIEGSGKGLLILTIALVALGADPSVMSEGSSDEEWRKRITAILLEAKSLILLDNLNRTLDSGALAAVLTCNVWRDRILGVSKTATVPNRWCGWPAATIPSCRGS